MEEQKFSQTSQSQWQRICFHCFNALRLLWKAGFKRYGLFYLMDEISEENIQEDI
jgi:hypothetical protein